MKAISRAILFLAWLALAAPALGSPEAKRIFSDVPHDQVPIDMLAEFLSKHHVARHRVVHVNVELLRELVLSAHHDSKTGLTELLVFDFFADSSVELYTYSARAEHLRHWSWTGVDSLDGNESVVGSFSIGFSDSVTGTFVGHGKRTRLDPLNRKGIHIIWESIPFSRTID